MDNIITSLQNPKIKQALKLKKASKRRKEELFLIEGYDEIIMALGAGIGIKTLFICPDCGSVYDLGIDEHRIGKLEPKLIKKGKVK